MQKHARGMVKNLNDFNDNDSTIQYVLDSAGLPMSNFVRQEHFNVKNESNSIDNLLGRQNIKVDMDLEGGNAEFINSGVELRSTKATKTENQGKKQKEKPLGGFRTIRKS